MITIVPCRYCGGYTVKIGPWISECSCNAAVGIFRAGVVIGLVIVIIGMMGR